LLKKAIDKLSQIILGPKFDLWREKIVYTKKVKSALAKILG